jgi:hypothetical protein
LPWCSFVVGSISSASKPRSVARPQLAWNTSRPRRAGPRSPERDSPERRREEGSLRVGRNRYRSGPPAVKPAHRPRSSNACRAAIRRIDPAPRHGQQRGIELR